MSLTELGLVWRGLSWVRGSTGHAGGDRGAVLAQGVWGGIARAQD